MSGCVHIAVCVCLCKTEREGKTIREQERHGGAISFQNAVCIYIFLIEKTMGLT